MSWISDVHKCRYAEVTSTTVQTLKRHWEFSNGSNNRWITLPARIWWRTNHSPCQTVWRQLNAALSYMQRLAISVAHCYGKWPCQPCVQPAGQLAISLVPRSLAVVFGLYGNETTYGHVRHRCCCYHCGGLITQRAHVQRGKWLSVCQSSDKSKYIDSVKRFPKLTVALTL